ncbi:MAG: DUF2269 family protein [Gammaproteobacteria bacterium]|jgi:uncharacterized membrane protein|nr:DUF2269 family protein [Gammaproteobacteria bacterium]
MILFIHIIFGTSLLGLSFSNAFYVLHHHRHPDAITIPLTLKLALNCEIFVLLPLLFLTLITGSVLIQNLYFISPPPWIISAFILMSLALLCRLASILILWKSSTLRFYFSLHILFWIIFVLIIHDAIVRPMHYFWQIWMPS